MGPHEVIVLVSGATATMQRYSTDERFGCLFTPGRWSYVQPEKRWAADNGSYVGFDADVFLSMLDRVRGYPKCLFVAAPDVVGNSPATDVLWQTWEPRLHAMGLPVAYVLQDGCTGVPWADCDAVFVGGSTDWKLSARCAMFVADAKARGKWTHMGRVNSLRRVRYATDIGIDSIDGTLFSKWPDIGFSRYQHWDHLLQTQPRLPL